ncbi:helix-turn-helix domain-containing protein [Chryseobacterium gambrini]|uniref:Helix-turn-helix domain-containing protein n=1 Tax=Chryseobacterium gambrini TaxID=373672 RepID=A0ABM8K8N2_9FLAO|nr:helix-turn-helix domain-containing protein [Chryseobacterium gambrini]
MNKPDYKLIYLDIINEKCPSKIKECSHYLNKKILTVLDIISINRIIFGTTEVAVKESQKFKCYDQKAIFKILMYQKENKLNNTQTAIKF